MSKTRGGETQKGPADPETRSISEPSRFDAQNYTFNRCSALSNAQKQSIDMCKDLQSYLRAVAAVVMLRLFFQVEKLSETCQVHWFASDIE